MEEVELRKRKWIFWSGALMMFGILSGFLVNAICSLSVHDLDSRRLWFQVSRWSLLVSSTLGTFLLAFSCREGTLGLRIYAFCLMVYSIVSSISCVNWANPWIAMTMAVVMPIAYGIMACRQRGALRLGLFLGLVGNLPCLPISAADLMMQCTTNPALQTQLSACLRTMVYFYHAGMVVMLVGFGLLMRFGWKALEDSRQETRASPSRFDGVVRFVFRTWFGPAVILGASAVVACVSFYQFMSNGAHQKLIWEVPFALSGIAALIYAIAFVASLARGKWTWAILQLMVFMVIVAAYFFVVVVVAAASLPRQC